MTTTLTLSTAESARVQELLADAYGARLLAQRPGEHGVAAAMTHTDVGPFAVSDVAFADDLSFEVDTAAALVISTVTAGSIQVVRQDASDWYRPGDVRISGTPNTRHRVHTHGLASHNFVLPMRLFYEVSRTEPGQDGPLRFTSLHPVSVTARIRWQNAARYVDDLLTNQDAAASPLLVGSAARMLAATALTVFPNNQIADPTAHEPADTSTVVLRRAIAFIEEHARQDISAGDIAAAAHVTVRSVQLAFRRHLDTTPMGYLRQVRLGHAHHELQDADPAQQTVTDIAYRWGFSSASRFSACYRNAYGLVPSITLRN